jgi:hypothetical protein
MTATKNHPVRDRQRLCVHCGKPFWPPRRGRPKEYCNDKCRVLAWRDRQNELEVAAKDAGAVV